MLNIRVGTREEQHLVGLVMGVIKPLHQIRRTSLGAAHFGDETSTLTHTYCVTSNHHDITHLSNYVWPYADNMALHIVSELPKKIE
jgi:hypothetical protein